MTDLFTNVVQASFYGSIVIGAVCLLRLVLKRAPKNLICLLWLLAGLRLMMPFEIESRFSLQPRVEPEVLQQPVTVQVPDVLMPETNPLPEAEAEVPEAETPIQENIPLATEQTHIVYAVEDGEIQVLSTGDILARVWLAGMAVMLVSSLVSYWKLKRKVREAWLTGDSCWECDKIDTAFVLGFLQPRIYLPVGMGDRERAFILSHERAHIDRRDYLWKLVGYGVLAVHWFNPLVWLAYSLLCRDMELACDEQVVKYMDVEQRKAYSAALLSCAAKHGRFAACPVAFGETDVKGRIQNVLNYKRPGFWITVVAVIAALFVAVCLLTSPVNEQSDNQVETVPAEWLEDCRSVLTTVQGRDAYHILEIREFSGDRTQNGTYTRNSFRYGDYWLRIDQGTDGYAGYMGLGEDYYDAASDDLSFEWRQVDMTQDAIFDPWLYSFNMSSRVVEALSRDETDEGYTIRLLVEEPFEIGLAVAENYYVDFCFDHEGNFLRAIQYVDAQEEIDGEIEFVSLVNQMIVVDVTGAEILSTIHQYAGEAAAVSLAQRMAQLSPEHIREIDHPRITRSEVAPAMSQAADHQIQREENIQPFWNLDVYLSGEMGVFSSEDESMSLCAGPEEGIVQVIWYDGNGASETAYFEDETLYNLVRSGAAENGVIDGAALAKYKIVLEARAEEAMEQAGDTWDFTGYTFTEFTKVDAFEENGAQYDVYAWDVAFHVEDPAAVFLAGEMRIDSELRVCGYEQYRYFVVCVENGQHYFHHWEQRPASGTVCTGADCASAYHDHSGRDCTEVNCTDASHGHSHHDH